jgi:hypothetical protein
MLPRARERRRNGPAAQDAEPTAEQDAKPAAVPVTGATRWVTWRAQAVPLLRGHWLACLLLAGGLVLRVLAQVAYQPALLYIDSSKYLYGAYPGSVPLGYRYLLKIILPVSNLGTVVAIQHLLGLAMAVVIYLLLQRHGVTRWLAALAMGPVLLDAYQVQMEEMIMPDVWLEALLVAGLALLLWRQVLSTRAMVIAGLLLGASATMWAGGELLIFPAVIYLLALGGGWRQALFRSVAMIVAVALPILAYCSVSDIQTGHFWLAASQSTIGRTAAAADCATLKVPADVRALCPSPSAQAMGPDWLEHSAKSPLFTTPIPPNTNKAVLLQQLNSAIKHQQPLRVAVAILRDSVRLFSPFRGPIKSVTPIRRWQFQTAYPAYPPWTQVRNGNILIGMPRPNNQFHLIKISSSYGDKAQVINPIATFLRDYQLDGGYTPGPLYLLLVLAALAGSVLVLVRRKLATAGQRAGLACLLFSVASIVLLFLPDVFEFSWRYEIPAVVLLPPAGIFGLMALLDWHRGQGAQPKGAPPKGARAKPQPEA